MSAAVWLARRVIVGMGDVVVSADPGLEIVTHPLRAGVGVVLVDPEARVAGLLHATLPQGSTTASFDRPARFVDTGVPHLLDACIELGADPARIVALAAGAADVPTRADRPDTLGTGERNARMLQRALRREGLFLRVAELGGTTSRTFSVSVGTGTITISDVRCSRTFRGCSM